MDSPNFLIIGLFYNTQTFRMQDLSKIMLSSLLGRHSQIMVSIWVWQWIVFLGEEPNQCRITAWIFSKSESKAKRNLSTMFKSVLEKWFRIFIRFGRCHGVSSDLHFYKSNLKHLCRDDLGRPFVCPHPSVSFSVVKSIHPSIHAQFFFVSTGSLFICTLSSFWNILKAKIRQSAMENPWIFSSVPKYNKWFWGRKRRLLNCTYTVYRQFKLKSNQ